MSVLLLSLLLQSGSPVATAPIPQPAAQPAAEAVDAEGEPLPDAAAVAERQRLNAAQIAKAEAERAAEEQVKAEAAAAERAHQAALAEYSRKMSEYEAAKAAYEQRQQEIADYNACYVQKQKDRCPPKPDK